MYQMQLSIMRNGKQEWLSIKSTNCDTPYQYKTKIEAIKMMDICYREVEPEMKRVKEV